MNQAQIHLSKLAHNLKSNDFVHRRLFSTQEINNMLNLLRESFRAWNSYSDMDYSTPHFHLVSLEKKYGVSLSEINTYFSGK